MAHERTQIRLVARGLALLLTLSLIFVLGGCDCDDDCDGECDGCFGPDYKAPAAPQGIRSVTGDGEVRITWLPNTESDLDGYRIYRNDQPDGYFERIATVGRNATRHVDRSVRNGNTYYYALEAFDYAGNQSELSYDDVFDTPRPEGFDLRVSNAAREPRNSGYDFSAYERLDYRDLEADIFYWFTEDEGYWMVATERSEDSFSDIQDAGYLTLDEVDWAPEDGWAPTGDVPLIEGHCYVVWTWDNRFAKFRVIDLGPDTVTVDWAYQFDRGNPELGRPGTAPSASVSGGSNSRSGNGNRTHRVGPERSLP